MDIFTSYESGIEKLLVRLEPGHPRRLDVLSLQARMRENITATRNYGDTETRSASRTEIIAGLNALTLEVIELSFNELSYIQDDLPTIDESKHMRESALGYITPGQPPTNSAEDPSRQVATWFKTHPRLEQRTFMITLAVFNGAKRRHIIDANRRLQGLLKPPPVEPMPISITSIFDSSRTELLGDAYALVDRISEPTSNAMSIVERIRFVQPAWQPAVLEYIWHEYDESREYILSWLYKLGFSSDPDLRDRAAAAVGQLSRYDYDRVLSTVIHLWANHDDSRPRSAAALALGVLVWDDQLVTPVLALLHHWSTFRTNWRLCWTAAAAYGVLVGKRCPDEALQDLRLIGQTNDWRLANLVRGSIANLFAIGQEAPEYYARVLDALDTWSTDPSDRPIMATWLQAFLEIADKATLQPPSMEASWPTLLWLASTDPCYRTKVLALWQRALNTRPTREAALAALRAWLLLADSNPPLAAALELMIGELISRSGARERERLSFCLAPRAAYPTETSDSVNKLSAVGAK